MQKQQPKQPAVDPRVDITPLPEGMSPWRYMAELLRKDYALFPEAAKPHIKEQIRWLYYLAEKIEAKHTQPVLMIAVASCSLDAAQRQWMIDVLEAVNQVAGTGKTEPEADEDFAPSAEPPQGA